MTVLSLCGWVVVRMGDEGRAWHRSWHMAGAFISTFIFSFFIFLLDQVSLYFFHPPGLGRWMKEAAWVFRRTHPSGQHPARLISST